MKCKYKMNRILNTHYYTMSDYPEKVGNTYKYLGI